MFGRKRKHQQNTNLRNKYNIRNWSLSATSKKTHAHARAHAHHSPAAHDFRFPFSSEQQQKDLWNISIFPPNNLNHYFSDTGSCLLLKNQSEHTRYYLQKSFNRNMDSEIFERISLHFTIVWWGLWKLLCFSYAMHTKLRYSVWCQTYNIHLTSSSERERRCMHLWTLSGHQTKNGSLIVWQNRAQWSATKTNFWTIDCPC